MSKYDDTLQVRGEATGPAPYKVVFALAFWVGAFVLFERIGYTVLGAPGSIAGVGVAIILILRTINFFVVSVPEVTGLVTVNLFNKGWMVSYGPGLHFKFPWEQAEKGNYINLRFESDSVDEDYPASDGVMLKLHGMFQYEPTLPGLPRYITSSEKTIKEGIGNVISGLVLEVIAGKTAKEARSQTGRINKKVKNFFEGLDEDGNPLPEEERKDFEKLYGIDLRIVSIPDLDYEERYQKALSSLASTDVIKQGAERIQKDSTISDKDAFNSSLIINDKVTKHVQEVEGEGGRFIAGTLMAMANAIGGNQRKGGS